MDMRFPRLRRRPAPVRKQSVREQILRAKGIDDALEIHARAVTDGGMNARTLRRNRAAVDHVRTRGVA